MILFCTFPHPSEINFWLSHYLHTTQHASESVLDVSVTYIRHSTQELTLTCILDHGQVSHSNNRRVRIYSCLR